MPRWAPRSLRDLAASTFLLVLIPTVYWFELFVVLPTFYPAYGAIYLSHVLVASYILLNVTGNLAAVYLTDTTINRRLLKPKNTWRLCATCETLAPPRSWHCNVCDACVLKRDHHCVFAGCCIGHYNYRYFYTFTAYVFVATAYASYYNATYAYRLFGDGNDFASYVTYVKLVFPLAMIFVDRSHEQALIFLCLVIGIGCVFTGVLLVYHTGLMAKGAVTHDRNREYDLGVMENVRVCLGRSWYLVWVCPWVRSELGHDGIEWVKRDDKSR